jgi:flagellar hook-basal body complex protein FliE
MTAPIGYPEKFGVLLETANRPAPRSELAQQPGLAPKHELGQFGQGVAPEKVLGPTFSQQLEQFVSEVDQTQKSAHAQAENFAAGRTNDIHGTMIEVEQAEISLRLLANVRNRVVDIYREVMRMGS